MPARVATGPFPTTLKGKSVFLHCRSKKHDAIIAKVERDEGSTTVILTFTGRLPTRPFLRGELASLEIRGFGALGMHLVQAMLENEYIDLVAISIDSHPSDMQMAWKNRTISLRIKDPRTIVFQRQNMEADEVVVRVFNDRVSWNEVSIDYVVDSLNALTDDKHVIHSMAYEGEDKANAYSRVHDEKGIVSQLPEVIAEMQVKLKYMKLVVTSADAFESVVSNVAKWDLEGDSARVCFVADDNPTERICNPFTEQLDNNFVLGRSAKRVEGVIDAISSVDASDRVFFLLRIFIDMIRRVPISGCHLAL